MVVTSVCCHADPESDFLGEPVNFCHGRVSTWNFFLGNANIIFWPKSQESLSNGSENLMLQYKVSNPRPLYYITSGGTTSLPVCYLSSCTIEILLFTVATDYRSNFAKTILFENCSCFSEIPFSISVESPRIFQCLISIPAGHWVRQIDGKSSATYLADSFCQLYSALWSAWQEDPNDPQERCAMARTSCARL